jgi:hypothetical protein
LPEYHANLFVLNQLQHVIKTVSLARLAGADAQIALHDADLFLRPPQFCCACHESFLNTVAFGVILDLFRTALTHVHNGQASLMMRLYLVRHDARSPRWLVRVVGVAGPQRPPEAVRATLEWTFGIPLKVLPKALGRWQ